MSDEDRKTYKHDSYGQISLGRTHGGSRYLYGSSIKHESTVRLEIHYSEHDRHLNNDWYHRREKIVELDVSPTQFSELIMSRDNYEGVPCTLRFTEKKGNIPFPEIKGKVETFEEEFKERMKVMSDGMVRNFNRCKEIFDQKGTVKKADRSEILNMMGKIIQEMRSNIPFVYDCFNEAMDKTILEAKGEVEAFVEHKLRSIGIENHAGGDMIVDKRKPGAVFELDCNIEEANENED